MRTITINYGHGVGGSPHRSGFEVVDDCGRTTGDLCLGELIEQVVGMVHPKLNEVRYGMCTPEQWEQRWSRARDKVPAEVLLQHTKDPDHGEHLA